jgi:hypothetical protein
MKTFHQKVIFLFLVIIGLKITIWLILEYSIVDFQLDFFKNYVLSENKFYNLSFGIELTKRIYLFSFCLFNLLFDVLIISIFRIFKINKNYPILKVIALIWIVIFILVFVIFLGL